MAGLEEVSPEIAGERGQDPHGEAGKAGLQQAAERAVGAERLAADYRERGDVTYSAWPYGRTSPNS